jgi:hypothetical protein
MYGDDMGLFEVFGKEKEGVVGNCYVVLRGSVELIWGIDEYRNMDTSNHTLWCISPSVWKEDKDAKILKMHVTARRV